MGVDIGIKVRIFQNDSDNYKEIEVSEQDNSLGSLFYSDEISYTTIKFSLRDELTEEDFELFKLQEVEDEEMMSCSKIIDIDLALKTFDKIYRKNYRAKNEALNNDLTKIDLLDITLEEKNKRKKSQIREYLGFENSFGIFVGILKTAKAFGDKVQIVAEFY
ncbi:MAG: hypothetical protein IPN94_22835 [Sphingobacteriales bacterium]|nr:hypothetical protein [Sphingobacteriales bacterium]